MAEQEREKRKKAQEEAQYLIRYTPELQQLLQKDTYETWKEEFTSFIRSFIRIHILNREAFDKALKYVKDRTEDAIRDNERIPKFRMGRYEKNFQFIEGLEYKKWSTIVSDDPIHEVLFNIDYFDTNERSSFATNDGHRALQVIPYGSIDEDRYVLTKFLDNLEEMINTPCPSHPVPASPLISRGISKVRNGMSSKGESFYYDLWILACNVSEHMYFRFETDYENQFRSLIDFISNIKINTGWQEIHGHNKGGKYMIDNRKIQGITKEYIDTKWMHTRWLTNYILTHLLDAEIDNPTYPKPPMYVMEVIEKSESIFRSTSDHPPWLSLILVKPAVFLQFALRLLPWVFIWILGVRPWLPSWMSLTPSWSSGFLSWLRLPVELVLLWGLSVGIAWVGGALINIGQLIYIEVQRERARRALQQICGEITSDHYDGREVMRWLRQQEKKGLHFHSLIYALLRLT